MKSNLISEAIEHPDRVLPFLKKKGRTILKGNKITGYYNGGREPEYTVLITTPMRVVHTSNSQYYRRPNMWVEGHEIINIFNRMGFVADICDLEADVSPPRDLNEYDVIFGGGSNFRKFARDSGEDVISVYFSSGRHWRDIKKHYSSRLSDLEERKGINYEPQRPELLEDRNITAEDGIICRGGHGTKMTWIENTEKDIPVKTVPISHPPGRSTDLGCRRYKDARSRFLWFGGNGLVLKGLDIVLDAFRELSDVELYVCGPINKSAQFKEIYSQELYNTENIHTIGWLEIYSKKYQDIMGKCGYLLYPSASEGMSGAVATSMWQGLVPVVTEQVYEPVGEWGIEISDTNIDSIKDIVTNVSQKPPGPLRKKSNESFEYARFKHDREHVSEKIEFQIRELLSDLGLDI